ncbi:hypothetical protein CHI95_00185 [Providencia rettgeri]|uniref:Phage tail protein n=1 Tax=Providencia rettgeri TaxID=587 RepID=A0A264VY87_PRORE|nr:MULTISPECIES: hypothetical protein [Providencia]MBQ0533482.1 hypothetical protein [Providencia huaxiensis]MBQ0587039.1 hypothetical protein [Providencia huaxiensis]OZS76290.1 hypothetical protein CHI95_00185 [Providencia rettgeri]
MKKIGDITSTADEHGEFTDGDPVAGIAPTQLMGKWFNSVQREILNVLKTANIPQSATNETQLSDAILKLISNAEFQSVSRTIDVPVINKVVTLPETQGANYTSTLMDSMSTVTLPKAKEGAKILWVVTQGTGANQLTYQGDILWSFGRKPVLSWDKGSVDVLEFTAIKENWLGRLVGGQMHVSQ